MDISRDVSCPMAIEENRGARLVLLSFLGHLSNNFIWALSLIGHINKYNWGLRANHLFESPPSIIVERNMYPQRQFEWPRINPYGYYFRSKYRFHNEMI